MKDLVKMGLVLMLITLVSATALSNVYLVTRDKIDKVEREKIEQARKMALPGAVFFKEDSTADGFVFHRGYDNQEATGDPVGYTALALGKGYSSTIRTVVGVGRDKKITGIKVAFQQETPGLGTKVEEVRKVIRCPGFRISSRVRKLNSSRLCAIPTRTQSRRSPERLSVQPRSPVRLKRLWKNFSR